ncbi:MAG: hypothetical protein Q8N98_02245 [bacterium]|nr:hypothetical protein [bacterium]
MDDLITKKALETIEKAEEILETKEILEALQISLGKVTRTKLFSRLNNLRGEGLIKGKFVGPGKGVWIWWKKNAFFNNISNDKSEVENDK